MLMQNLNIISQMFNLQSKNKEKKEIRKKNTFWSWNIFKLSELE